MILLDTNVIIDVLGGARPQVRERLGSAQTAGHFIGLSSVALFELRFGIANSTRRAENERRLDALIGAGISVVEFNAEDAREAGELRAALRKSGGEIGPYDLLIAAQARQRKATLVTHNLREFQRVPGLSAVDWVE